MKSNYRILLYGLCIFCMAACTHNAENAAPVVVCTSDTMSMVSFSKDVVPIFVNNCNSSGCHTGTNPAGHLGLDAAVAYAQLYQPGTGNIDTVTPRNSLLYSQLLSTADPMPPGGQLDKCDIALILKWIQQGGKDN
jgi:hypothetical protein